MRDIKAPLEMVVGKNCFCLPDKGLFLYLGTERRDKKKFVRSVAILEVHKWHEYYMPSRQELWPIVGIDFRGMSMYWIRGKSILSDENIYLPDTAMYAIYSAMLCRYHQRL